MYGRFFSSPFHSCEYEIDQKRPWKIDLYELCPCQSSLPWWASAWKYKSQAANRYTIFHKESWWINVLGGQDLKKKPKSGDKFLTEMEGGNKFVLEYEEEENEKKKKRRKKRNWKPFYDIVICQKRKYQKLELVIDLFIAIKVDLKGIRLVEICTFC